MNNVYVPFFFFFALIYICVYLVLSSIISSMDLFQVAEGYPPNLKKALLLHFLDLFQLKTLGLDHLVMIMQMLILPMLAHSFQNGQSWEVVDQAIIKTIVDKLLDPPEEVVFLFFLYVWIFSQSLSLSHVTKMFVYFHRNLFPASPL